MSSVRHHLRDLWGRTFGRSRGEVPRGGIPYSFCSETHYCYPRPKLSFYWYPPLSAVQEGGSRKKTGGLRSWFSRLGGKRKSA